MQIRPLHAAALCAAICGTAQASLGGDAASIAADQSAWHATQTRSNGTGYTDYRLTLPDGLIVHEFLNGAGKVFEVSWAGKGHKPDMTRLLGTYSSRITAAAPAAGPMQRRADAVAPDVEMHASMHQRFFSGVAHLPKELPAALAGPVPLEVQ